MRVGREYSNARRVKSAYNRGETAFVALNGPGRPINQRSACERFNEAGGLPVM